VCAFVFDSTVRLGQDRLRDVLESGTVRVCEIPRIAQRGEADHQVDPGGARGKCLEDREATWALGIEKHGEEEPSGHRFWPWVVRHAGWLYGGDGSPVQQTGDYLAEGEAYQESARMVVPDSHSVL